MSAIEVLKRNNLVDWHALLVGLERGWCERTEIIGYAERQLMNAAGTVDGDLVSIVLGGALSDSDFLLLIDRFLDAHNEPMSDERRVGALEKWRFAYLHDLLQGGYSSEEKISRLQEVYAQFGFPGDMASCSIYCNDGIDPLCAAKMVAEALQERLVKG